MQDNSLERTTSQHFEEKVWVKGLNYYRDELNLFEHQLEKMVGKCPKKLLPKIEHFQNQFIRQHEVLDELHHELRIYEDALLEKDTKTPKIISDPIPNHKSLQMKIERFSDLFRELKEEFVDFIQSI